MDVASGRTDTYRCNEKIYSDSHIKITDARVEKYVFVDVESDLAPFNHVPIRNVLLIQNLEDMADRQRIKDDAVDFDGYNPKKVILDELRKSQRLTIDYEICSALLIKLISQLCDHYTVNHERNVVMMYKRDIANKLYAQIMQHFYCKNGFLQEEVVGTREYNFQQTYNWRVKNQPFWIFHLRYQKCAVYRYSKGRFQQGKV